MTTVAEPAAEQDVFTVEQPHEGLPGWQPNVLAFACHYCAFAAADLAGVMRLSYPPNVKIIRLPVHGQTGPHPCPQGLRAGGGWRLCRRLTKGPVPLPGR